MRSRLEASIDRALVAAAAFALARPGATLAMTGVLTVLSVVLGFGMTFRAEVSDLVPASTADSLRRLEEVFGAGESAYLLVRASRPAPEELVELARGVASRLEAQPLVRSVTFGWSELADRMLSPEVLAHAPLFAGPAELAGLEELLTPEGILAQVRKQAFQLGLPGIGQAESWAERDPLELRRFLVSRVSGMRGGFRFLPGSLHFVSEDARSILIRVDGRVPASEIPAVKTIMHSVRAAVDASREAAVRSAATPLEVQVGYTGGYEYAFETEAVVRADLTWNNVGSMALVLLLVAIAYRRVLLVLPSFVALSIGMVLGFGAFALIRRDVVTLAFVSGAALAGLGIDYVIYITLRAFSDPRGPCTASVLSAVEATGRPILLAAVATAAGFLTFPLTGEKFLSDVGLLSAVGIIVCGIVAIVVLPALLAPWARKGDRGARSGTHVRAMRPWDFGAGLLTRTALAWPGTIFVLSAISGIACIVYLVVRPPELERDLRRMQPADSDAVRTQTAIAETFGGAESPAFLFVEGSAAGAIAAGADSADPEVEAVEASARLEAPLEELHARGLITAWTSPASLIPPLVEQRAARELLLKKDAGKLEEAFRAALDAEGFEVQAFQPAIDTLRKALRPSDLVTPALLRRLGLAGEIDKLVGSSEGKGYALVAVNPAKQLWRSEDQELITSELEAALRKAGARGEVAGLQVLSSKGAAVLLGEFLRVSGIATAAIVIIVILCFRGWLGSTLALLPVVLGTLWMMVACDLCGVRLNFMNVGVLPMVLGTGVDIGIHIARQYLDDPGGDVRALTDRVGGSIMLAVLTTLASFGTMVFSESPGLASVGSMSAIGTTTCLIACLVTVPAVMVVHARWRGRARVRGMG